MKLIRNEVDDLKRFADKNRNAPTEAEFQLLRNRVDDCEKADNSIRKTITDL